MPTLKPSRRERNKIRNRQEILAAALDVFAEKGFHDASIQEIADHAEFAVGTLYSLFDSKEELYRALLVEHNKKFFGVLEEALDRGTDEYEQLVNYIGAKGEAFEDNLKMVRLYFSETRGGRISMKAGLPPDLKRHYEDFFQRVTEVFRRGIEKKIFRDLDPTGLALSLTGMTDAFIFRWLEDPERHWYRAHVDTMVEVFFGPVLLTAPEGAPHDTDAGAPGRPVRRREEDR